MITNFKNLWGGGIAPNRKGQPLPILHFLRRLSYPSRDAEPSHFSCLSDAFELSGVINMQINKKRPNLPKLGIKQIKQKTRPTCRTTWNKTSISSRVFCSANTFVAEKNLVQTLFSASRKIQLRDLGECCKLAPEWNLVRFSCKRDIRVATVWMIFPDDFYFAFLFGGTLLISFGEMVSPQKKHI